MVLISRLLLLGFALLALPVAAQTVTQQPVEAMDLHNYRALPVHVGGRVVEERSDTLPGFPAYRHQWPGVYFEAAFKGETVLLRFDDSQNEYRLYVDEAEPIAILQPGRSALTVSGLASGPHRLRLEKVTESARKSALFGGFLISGKAEPLSPVVRHLQFEFIGDSSMAGFGMRSGKRDCTGEEARLTTDTQAAYPALVSRYFDADYEINAISGRGLIRNAGGGAVNDPIVHAYGYDVRDRQIVRADRPWHPQLIVVQLFADFVGKFKPGERWASDAQLAAEWVVRYAEFLAQLQRQSPKAAIILRWFDVERQKDPRALALLDGMRSRLEAEAARLGVQRLFFLRFPGGGFENMACASHLNARDHRIVADEVIAFIKANDLAKAGP